MKDWREVAHIIHEEACAKRARVRPWSPQDALGMTNWYGHEAAELADILTKESYDAYNWREDEFKRRLLDELGDMLVSQEIALECIRRAFGVRLSPEMLDRLAEQTCRKLMGDDRYPEARERVGEGWSP